MDEELPPATVGVAAIVRATLPPARKIDHPDAKPNRGRKRLSGVNANLTHHPDHPVVLELLLRLVAVVLAAFAILGLLPAIAQAAL